MTNLNLINWPCKCGHVDHHDDWAGAQCKSKCICTWYRPMSNLEYLEFKNETQ